MHKTIIKNIWYPGSGYASESWISYLRKNYLGRWIYSNISDNWSWEPRINDEKRQIFDTFNVIENPKIQINTLIISRHSGLRTFLEILNSGILSLHNPDLFIYDPGTEIGDLTQHISEVNNLENIGYKLNKIDVLPHLFHQYCEYEKII
jgi:hypothetical protein